MGDENTKKVFNKAQPKAGSELPYRILLVDDEAQMRELHADLLNDAGYNVDTAPDGIVAWNTLNEISYDLLITDNNMPRLSGLDLIKRVRSEGMSLPIILASGTIQMEELNQNPQLRIDAVLHKPFLMEELLSAIQNILPGNNP